MRFALLFLTATLLGLPSATRAQHAVVCEASPATRREMAGLSGPTPITEALHRQQQLTLQRWIAQDPDNLFLHLEYLLRSHRLDEKAKAIAQYKELLDKHPANTQYEFLYAVSLVGTHTSEAISRLKAISVDDPIAPIAHLELAHILTWGKFADHDVARAQIVAYYDACPGSLSLWAGAPLRELSTPEMAARYKDQLRKSLEGVTDVTQLAAWYTVWDLEFLAVPPIEHERLRPRLATEIQHLRQIINSDDLGWLSTLKDGYRDVGNKKAEREIEDRIVARYPGTEDAIQIVDERWFAAHPYPKAEAPEQEKQSYWRAVITRADAQLKKNPDDAEALRERFNALDNLNGVTNDDLAAAAEAFRGALRGDVGWFSTPPSQFGIARIFLDKKIHVDEVPALVAEGNGNYLYHQDYRSSDQNNDDTVKIFAHEDCFVRLQAADLLLGAATQLSNPEIAASAVQAVSRESADLPHLQQKLWEVKAKWAELNGRKLDAMLMYRASLDVRPANYKFKAGKPDEIKEAYDRLWKELGGTEDGKQAWLKSISRVELARESDWEKPGKDLPAWELSDLQGKTWKVADLRGKTVLINIWASWCGPCRAELPYLQTLYEKTKNRTDIQILSFNVDDEIGDIAPYVKDNKFTFPVLIAKDFASHVLADGGVPRNWILDAEGKWRWQQEGFGNGEGWEKSVMDKLGSGPEK